MASGPLKVAVIGCGNISKGYGQTMLAHRGEIEIRGAYDMDPARAEAFAGDFGGQAYASQERLLADPSIEAVVNLTIHQAHAAVIRAALNAGKHVLTEKPLTTDPTEAAELVALAREKGLMFCSAPITFLGEGQQTVGRLLRSGRIGKVRAVYAEMNWGRIEHWHPNPAPFYDVGAVFDVGVYPLTLVTAFLGPAKSVRAFGRAVMPDRLTKDGTAFHITTPDWVCAGVELESGAVLRLTTSFYTRWRPGTVEFHGDDGQIALDSVLDFDSAVRVQPAVGGEWETVPPAREPFKGVEWARSLVEMHDALREGRRPRVTGEHAAHVIEIAAGIHRAVKEGGEVTIHSRFEPPTAMPWAG